MNRTANVKKFLLVCLLCLLIVTGLGLFIAAIT